MIAGAAARSARNRLGLTTRALAARVGLTAPRVTQLEQGESWSLKNLETFAAEMGIDPIEMIGGVRLNDAERAVLSAVRAGNYAALMEAALAAMRKNQKSG